MSLVEFIGYARKFLIALGGALAILLVALSDDVVTKSEWVQVAIGFLAAAGVYQFKNEEL